MLRVKSSFIPCLNSLNPLTTALEQRFPTSDPQHTPIAYHLEYVAGQLGVRESNVGNSGICLHFITDCSLKKVASYSNTRNYKLESRLNWHKFDHSAANQ
ncbi:hypothetical protein AVEN_125711-1 [Araneus ventricosus]|uniref:Uncharacterized protein n=1 Tax=Araneus ventricosus TaxID=182803 RepID=A0A4Y2IXY5_ARAVE|nr:hypothetical protein AVEN_125711-1 [Araneus ventricosus]